MPKVPGSISTYATAINDNNVITGSYVASDGVDHGFVGTLNGEYTTFDFPNGHTRPTSINNDGYIVGLANVATDECPYAGCEFMRDPAGTIAGITRNGAPLDGVADGIAAHQRFVGSYSYFDGDTIFYYGYYGKDTKYRADLTLPFDTDDTQPRGLNKSGTVTGYFASDRGNRGFYLKNGIATEMGLPDVRASGVFVKGLNDHDVASGYWYNPGDTFERAFLVHIGSGKYQAISVRHSVFIEAGGINNAGLATVNIDGIPYIYCSQPKKSCLSGTKVIEIPDKWSPAVPSTTHSILCRDRCIGPRHRSLHRRVNRTAVREAMKRDPELQRELHLPFRP
jgi:hypothetical protein